MSDNRQRVNERIRFSPVMVIRDGAQLGIMPTFEALKIAREAGLDLVEVSPDARPPVCLIADYGKLQYEKTKKQKHQKQPKMKEMRLRPNIGEHDLKVKTDAIRKFLEQGDSVQVHIRFTGREIQRKNLGQKLLSDILARLSDVGTTKGIPCMRGWQLNCLIEPKKK
jgi:translation initiation factor IF-3